MSPEVAELKRQLQQLSEEEREELALFLLDTLPGYDSLDEAELVAELDRRSAEMDSGSDPGEDADAVLAELNRRVADVESGRVTPIPVETVFAEMRDRHR